MLKSHTCQGPFLGGLGQGTALMATSRRFSPPDQRERAWAVREPLPTCAGQHPLVTSVICCLPAGFAFSNRLTVRSSVQCDYQIIYIGQVLNVER